MTVGNILLSLLALGLTWLLLSPYVLWSLLQKKLFQFDEEAKGSPPDFVELCRALRDQGFKMYPVQLRSASGRLLFAYYFQHPTSHLVFNFKMGRNNSLLSCVSFIRVYSRVGSVFICEPEGFGESKGTPTFANFVGCGITSHLALIQMGYANDQIIPCGDSLGSAAATTEAVWAGSRAVILSAPFESLVRMAKEQLPLLRLYPKWMFPRHTRMDNLENLRVFAKPTLLLHGVHDDLIPFAHAETLKAGAAGQTTLIELNAKHRDTAGSDPETFETAVTMFVGIWLSPPPGDGGAKSDRPENPDGGSWGPRLATVDGVSVDGSNPPTGPEDIAPPAANRFANDGGPLVVTIITMPRYSGRTHKPLHVVTGDGSVVQRFVPRIVPSDGKRVDPKEKDTDSSV